MYINDVHIASKDEQEQCEHHRLVLQRFQEYGIYVSNSNYIELAEFLGPCVDGEGSRALQNTTTVIPDYKEIVF